MKHLLATCLFIFIVFFSFTIVALAEEHTYKVQKGDTLWKIARQHQVNLDELMEINGLKSDLIHIGTILKIPAKKGQQRGVDDTSYITYHVKKGDNLWTLARRYDSSIEAIKRANGLKSDLIIIGQRLQIPRLHKQQTMRTASLSSRSAQGKKASEAYTAEDVEWLARIIEAEAGNQSYLGKLAVGSVVINRKNNDQFPDTIKEVIFQKGQFTPVANGRIHKVKPSEESFKAAREVLKGIKDPTEGALFFYNPRIATDRWIRTREVIKDIGQHRFAL